MPSKDDLQTLTDSLCNKATVLSNPGSLAFTEYLKRWSNINLQTPSAIAVPQSEDDCLKIVWHLVGRFYYLGLT